VTLILQYMRPEFIMRGDRVVQKGSLATKLRILVEGKIGAKNSDDGFIQDRRSLKGLQLTVLDEGAFFGQACLFYEVTDSHTMTRKATAHLSALTDCELLSLDAEIFHNHLRHYYPAFSNTLLTALAPDKGVKSAKIAKAFEQLMLDSPMKKTNIRKLSQGEMREKREKRNTLPVKVIQSKVLAKIHPKDDYEGALQDIEQQALESVDEESGDQQQAMASSQLQRQDEKLEPSA